jgi:DNA-binding transcriptional MerR regulator
MFAQVMKKEQSSTVYSVKKLSDLAGVSVRTLHLYDEMGLLKPSVRTEAGYRMYGEKELLRLQQILFYKELEFSLQQIAELLDDPAFDLVAALESHKLALKAKQDRLSTFLITIEKTIYKLKNSMKLSHEELYEGLPKEKAEYYRKGAMEQYGEKTVLKSENSLRQLGKEGFQKLKDESHDVTVALLTLVNQDPSSAHVQELIDRHYQVIRKFWGTDGEPDKQAEAYAGLGQLYVDDERYTMFDGKPNPQFASFMSKAMSHYAQNKLQ